ncbi:MAG TPA: serine/threonine-protein kinase [Burkholderiales bacterium]|nr:serine/threonine-protein kinase [Burkholderiales bacterium]
MTEPQTLGRYTILGELGRGAMGVVYKASDPMLNRTVAIKTINMAADPEEREEYEKRFYQEAKAAGGLSHPNIVTIFDIGHAGDVVYMAMEFVPGNELKSLLASHLVEPQAALDIGAQVAEGLAYAHERGVVHRDVKPANIMVARGGPAKIMDFGIARMRQSDVKTQTGMLLGSPKYMSPEQLLGGAVDHRCDIFALGVVIYEAAVGVAPFSGDDITQIMYQIVNAAPPAPSAIHAHLPAMLDLVLARALAKNPDARYQDARELAADLRACGAQLAAAAAPAGEDDATQTLPIGAFSLPGADDEKTITLPPRRAPPQREPRDAGPRLRISRRFDSTEAAHRLAAGAGDDIERTVRLDRAALAAASVPPPAASKRTAEPVAAPRSGRWRLILWVGVTIAALVAVAIAFG